MENSKNVNLSSFTQPLYSLSLDELLKVFDEVNDEIIAHLRDYPIGG